VTLPESGWRGYGSPSHPYTLPRASLLRANDAEYALREVAFRSWLIRCPHKAAEVNLALEMVLLSERRL
jgi:hypothetical protein